MATTLSGSHDVHRAPLPVTAADVSALAALLSRHHRLVVLTGAGCSTASGIPDYRNADGDWKRARPVMYADFIGKEATRRRYWARSLVGFRRMRHVQPNAAHHALAQLERDGRVTQLITQNVDGLHQAAGSVDAIDLHGRIDTVRCLGCGLRSRRDVLQRELERRNPSFARLDGPDAPDGDADLADVAFDTFDVPACERCGGMLKPDVVFFGEGVPPARVERAMQALQQADALLVVGSSLMVYSGFRFALAMAAEQKPIAAINRGRTRADHLLAMKVDADCGEALQLLVARLR